MSFYGLIAHFLFGTNCIVWMYQFVYPLSTEGHLSCSQVLAIMDEAAINICVHVFCEDIGF